MSILKKFLLILLAAFLLPAVPALAAEEPVILPDTLTIRSIAFSIEEDFGEVSLTTSADGSFSFTIPDLQWSDEFGHTFTQSAFPVAGTARVAEDDVTVWSEGGNSVTVSKDKIYAILENAGQSFVYHEHLDIPETLRDTVKNVSIRGGWLRVSLLPDMAVYEFILDVHVEETLHEVTKASGEVYDHAYSYDDRISFDLNGPAPVFSGTSGPSAGDSGGSGPAGSTEGGGTSGTRDRSGSRTLEALMVSILAILISILFGSSAGFVPPVPAGAPSGAPPEIHTDRDGDLTVTDPVSGARRIFVHNGDGTYTDPVTGATYTREELERQLEHRRDNAGTIGQDDQWSRRTRQEDASRNQERSSFSLDSEETLKKESAKSQKATRMRWMADRLGIRSDASREHIQDAYEHERDTTLAEAGEQTDRANELDDSIEVLETYETVADYAVTAGEVLPGGGQVISATYKGIKNVGATVAEKGATAGYGAVVEGVIKGGTEAASTVMSGVSKAGVTITGTMAGTVAEAINDGTDLTDAALEGLTKGATDASVGALSDAAGDTVKGEGLMNYVSEATVKMGETAYGKEITGPEIEEKFKK